VLDIQHIKNVADCKLQILKKLQFMCIDSAGWPTVEKVPYFVILTTSAAGTKLDLRPSIFAVLCLPSDIFLLACFEFDNRL
jgi:hypothetical protein